MKVDRRLAVVNGIAQGLLTTAMEGSLLPFVVRTASASSACDMIEAVASLGAITARRRPDLPAIADLASAPPRLAIVRPGAVGSAVAEHALEICAATPDTTMVVLVIDTDDRASMDAIGRAAIARGVVVSEEDLAPGQCMPSLHLLDP